LIHIPFFKITIKCERAKGVSWPRRAVELFVRAVSMTMEDCAMCKRFLYAFLGVAVLTSYAVAQVPGTMRENETTTQGQAMTSDQMAQMWQQNAARCMLLDNQAGVLINEFSLERIQNPEVKQFAQSLVKDHNDLVAKLQRFVPGSLTTDAVSKRVSAIRAQLKSEKGTMPVTTEAGDSSRRTEVPAPAVTEDQGRMSMEGKNMMQIIPAMQQTMAENCVAFTEAELSQVDKDQFDKAYIGQQIYAHVDALAKLKTMETFAPASLKPIIQSASTTVQSHLDQAKNICKQLDEKKSSSSHREHEDKDD
jgi:predicted outer membrane protein